MVLSKILPAVARFEFHAIKHQSTFAVDVQPDFHNILAPALIFTSLLTRSITFDITFIRLLFQGQNIPPGVFETKV